MTRKRWRMAGIVFLLLLMAGCQSSAPTDVLKGRITLWHSWSPAEAAVLDESLAQFEEIHPQVNITTVALPRDKMLEEFYRIGNDGLGPGMMIGGDSWIGGLADDGLIRPFSTDAFPAAFFNTRNTSLMLYQDKIYGVPMILAPYALYYNKDLVTTPPESLDDLLADAAEGRQIAFVPRFVEAYWGIQTFGDGFFDNEGRFTLAQSGFLEWLDWLDDAQQAPGVILNEDNESLLDLFAAGKVAYYVARPESQQTILAKMDEAKPFEMGVVPLPQGPAGSAGPVLTAESIFLYSYASENQSDIVNALASFLVNQQQSIRFLRELDAVPANPSVRVDNRIYPIANGFARQARTAVVIANEISTVPSVAAGNRAYITVLSGIASPEEAVCQFGLDMAEIMSYSAEDMDLPDGCSAAPVDDGSLNN